MADKALTVTIVGRDKSAGKTFKQVGEQAEKTGGSFKRMAEIAGGALAAIGIGQALGAVKNYLSSSLTAYAEARSAQIALEDAYARFPAVASVSIDSLRELNQELMAKTRFDDDAYASGQAVLAQFGLTGEQLAELTPLMADYAAKTGVDMGTAADQLGKALLGQGRALKGVGIDFVDAGSTAANYDQLIAGLRTQVSGFAEKDAVEGAGALARMKNQMDEVKESIGAGLLPVLAALATMFVTNVVPGLQAAADATSAAMMPAFEGILAAITPVVAMFAETLGPVLQTLGPQILQLVTAFSPLSLILQALAPVLPMIADLLAMVGTILSGALASVIPVITELVGGLATILSGVLGQILPIIAALLENVGEVLMMVFPVVHQLASAIGGVLLVVLEAISPLLVAVAEFIGMLFEALMPLVQPILEIVMAFMPLIELLGMLAGEILGVVIELLMALLEPILGLIPPLMDLLVPALQWLAQMLTDVVVPAIQWFVGLMMDVLLPVFGVIRDGLVAAFTGIASFVGDAFRNVANFIVGGINTVIDLVNGAIDLINGLGEAASLVTGGAISWTVGRLPKIPALAAGGIAMASTLALIGEGTEPEVVAPLSKLPGLMADAGVGGGGGGDVQIIMHADAAALQNLVSFEIRRADRGDVLAGKMGYSK